MAGTYGNETISPRERAGMSGMRDESAQGTGGHVLFEGSKSPVLYVLCGVKLNVQLLAAFDGSAGLHERRGWCCEGTRIWILLLQLYWQFSSP